MTMPSVFTIHDSIATTVVNEDYVRVNAKGYEPHHGHQNETIDTL